MIGNGILHEEKSADTGFVPHLTLITFVDDNDKLELFLSVVWSFGIWSPRIENSL